MQNLARVSNEVSNDDLGTHVAAEAAAKSTTFVLWYGTIINNLNNSLKVIIQLDCARLFWILKCQKKLLSFTIGENKIAKTSRHFLIFDNNPLSIHALEF